MIIQNKSFDEERALYGSKDIVVTDCIFDGSADGESPFKECGNVQVENCRFNLRYPFWHDKELKIGSSEMTPQCRAALWYSSDVKITETKMHGIKALRECANVEIKGCDIVSPEFGWFNRSVRMTDCRVESEYFMMRSYGLNFNNVKLLGKYSFQYIEDSVFDNCTFDTKDAFWHAKNVIIKNSTVKGEYLAWYSENVIFENCEIIGTQPLCYCKNLRLIDCKMTDADLCFERSDVEAVINSPVISIKNPLSGTVFVPEVGEIIMDIDEAEGKVVVGEINDEIYDEPVLSC